MSVIIKTFEVKSKENMSVAEKYLKSDKQYYNVVANRAYYAAFQVVKKYLSGKGVETNKHGELRVKIKDVASKNNSNLSFADLIPFDKLSTIYDIRLTADYSEIDVGDLAANDSFDYAKDIIELVEKLK